MAEFNDALQVLLGFEGGFSCDADDHGGETCHGITLRSAKAFFGADFTADDLNHLSADQVADYYRGAWWDLLGLDRIDDQVVATQLLMAAVNMGPVRAVRIVQSVAGVVVDGALGPRTVQAINQQGRAVAAHLAHHLAAHYESICQHDSSQQKFLKGWLRRARWGVAPEVAANEPEHAVVSEVA